MYIDEREKLIDAYREALLDKCPFINELELRKAIASFSTGLDLAFACYQDDVDYVIETFKDLQGETILN